MCIRPVLNGIDGSVSTLARQRGGGRELVGLRRAVPKKQKVSSDALNEPADIVVK